MGGRQFWRELLAGRMRVLFAAVVLAVLGVSTVAMIAERVRGALLQQAGQLLGGDLVLRAGLYVATAIVTFEDNNTAHDTGQYDSALYVVWRWCQRLKRRNFLQNTHKRRSG